MQVWPVKNRRPAVTLCFVKFIPREDFDSMAMDNGLGIIVFMLFHSLVAISGQKVEAELAAGMSIVKPIIEKENCK